MSRTYKDVWRYKPGSREKWHEVRHQLKLPL